MLRKQRPCRARSQTAAAVPLLIVLLVGILIAAQAAAQSGGNPCIKEQVGSDPPCTADDVRFVALEMISGPPGCVLGNTVTVTVKATIESGPERFDVGLWINEKGGSALSDPDGTCYRDYLHPVSSDNADCNQDGGPYYNGSGEADSCGDVPAVTSDPCGSLTGPCSEGGGTCLFTTQTVTVDVVCSDGDGNGLADTGWATSWEQLAGNDCMDEMDTDPGTGSKCVAHDFVDFNDLQIFCADIDPAAECCDPGTGNVTPIDDGVDCTEDVCDPNTGTVTHTPDHGSCDDGLYCNGAETCDPTLGCQPGTDPCVPPLLCDEAGSACVGCLMDGDCDDGVACTADTCVSGSCVYTADHGSCDDGLYCNGAEVCDPGLGCQPGSDPCQDGNACTDDVCDEDLDACENSCNATGSGDPCCSDTACSEDPVCEQAPVCGDGVIDPGEICGEPGLEECPAYAPICLDCADCGIPVELVYFQALGADGIVTLVWRTVAEIDTAGFNLLRAESEDGVYGKINQVLIPAQGGPTQGAEYSYIDNGVRNGTTYWYRLEDVDLTGESHLHDPVVSVMPAANNWSATSNAQASAIGTAPGAGSKLFNSIAVILVPVGAALILRRRQKRK